MKRKPSARTMSRRGTVQKKNSSRRRYILNCNESKDRDNDWKTDTASVTGLLRADPIPSSVDLRESWWRVGNQKDTGSCVGWATADSVLRWHFVDVGSLTKTEKLSVRFVWMASKETDVFTKRPTTFIESDGTSLKAALDIARKFGCVRDSLLPFGTGGLYKGETKIFYAIASRMKIASYFNLGTDPDEWRRWLAHNGPILTRLDVDATWYDAKATKGKLRTYKPQTAEGGHAVSMVGYTPKHFIIRNSWGTGWGDRGFAYASNDYAKAAFTEAYGVVA